MLLRDIKYVFIFLGVPTLIFAAVTPFLFFSRAMFILDYVLLCLIASYISRRNLILLWLIIFLLDWLFSVAPTYHFESFDFFRNAYAVAFMSWQMVLFAGALMSLVVVGVFVSPGTFLSETSIISRRSKGVVISLALVLVVLDIVNGTNGRVEGIWRIMDNNIAGAHLPQLASAARTTLAGYEDVTLLHAPQPAVGATSHLFSTLIANDAPVHDKILLVIVESFGAPLGEKLKYRYAEIFNRTVLRERFEIHQGEVPFAGSTVPGEIRELCGRRITSTSAVGNIKAEDCLPHMLKAVGYQTIALHGYSPYMFDRNTWYPRLGFSTTLFGEDIDSLGYKDRCGSIFRGSCDSDVAKLIQLHFAHGGTSKQFIYWLTLNSHLPVARDTSLGLDLECSELLTVDDHEEHQEACRLSSLLLGLVNSIVDIAERTEGNLQVIIVGDHAPPFVWKEDRRLFKPGVVPFIVLASKRPAANGATK